ncbi:MAG: aldehyde dehydrogenase family protein [Deltaproteobacteria bacterium]|nr:aldehyde dehydrogenase family protein [Deltaproteobacteria bacterium]
MTSASMEMSAGAKSASRTNNTTLDELLQKLSSKAKTFARLTVAERVTLLARCVQPLHAVAPAWVDAALRAKGLRSDHPEAFEEWAGGPMTTLRNVRLLLNSLRDIASRGKPYLAEKNFTTARDGVTLVEVFPADGFDKATMAGITAKVRLQPGVDARKGRERQASFYDKRDPDGGVALVLGAGNVASIPPMDALYKMFVEGHVCLVKLNPVNEYLGPFFEKGLAPLVEAGYLAFVYGGGEVGAYLVEHPLVTDVHITGSDRTHDLIVWGPPGEERTQRIQDKNPKLKKTISSELGCVTPVVIAPAVFSEKELDFLSQNIAAMMVNNASCNCNAGKMLVTSKGWAQRDALLAKLKAVLATVPSRKAYYPGAFDRYEHLVGGRAGVVSIGERTSEKLPWTLVEGLDASSGDRLFTTEPFCPIMSETILDEQDPVKFLAAATTFCNDTLWGTLSGVLIVHPSIERDEAGAIAVDEAIAKLRYGAVGVNQWTGLVYGSVSPPWGAHPSSTLENIQGGLGWVHNTFMLEEIEKVVLRGPIHIAPKPPWFPTNKVSHKIGKRLVDLEADPSWLKIPGIAITALGG